MKGFTDISIWGSFTKQFITTVGALVSLLVISSSALAANYYIDDDIDWSDLSPQPTSTDVIYIYDGGELTIDVNNAECAAIYIGYASGSYDGEGTVEFEKNSMLTVYSAAGVVIGNSSDEGEIDMDDGGTLVTPSMTVLNSDSEFETGKGTLILTGNNTLPVEFTKYGHLVISAGTTLLSGDIEVKGDLTIDGTLDVSTLSFQISVKGGWINNGTFVAHDGAVQFTGGKQQSISGTNTTAFGSLELNQKGKKKGKGKGKQKGVFLDAPVYVKAEFALTQGIMYTNNVSYITLEPSATTSGGSDASHVDGRIKIETDTIKTIVVGTGKNGKLKKTVVATTSTDPSVFIAEYFDQPHPAAAAMGIDITHICNMQYWELVRESGTADATLSLHWDDANCGPMSLMAALTVARYDTVEWVSAGNTGISGDPYSGSVTSDTLSAYGCFTYGCNHNS
ncbi:MAG: hypothetical protein JKX73_09165, partial [Flavobacteriales bacterium]|nr:hypothetical protein [Flavobacteriales bacterium]